MVVAHTPLRLLARRASFGTVRWMRWSLRFLLAAATPVVQIGVATGLGVFLSRIADGGSSGWGGLIGMVVGIIIGNGLGLAAMLFVVGSIHRRTLWWRVVVPALAVAVSAAFIISGASMGFAFWGVVALYLAASAAIVMWCSGRARTTASDT